ncbi:MAG: hypothetical protein P0116_01140 [Candidatus Nitrosocosmicus sp.]|nr:hypothetical protein [Candidatus Nitrosocosmicus sp.]
MTKITNSGNKQQHSNGNDDDDDDDDDDDGNILTKQSVKHNFLNVTKNALCVSGTGTFVSCNNLNTQNQQNSGNNALAQQGVAVVVALV